MAKKAKPPVTDIGKVRIPSRLLRELDDFTGQLYKRILNAAVERAFARKSGDTAGRVVDADIRDAVRRLLPTAEPILLETMNSTETHHAARKAS